MGRKSEKSDAPIFDTFHKFSLLPTKLKVKILRKRLLVSSPISDKSNRSHSSRALLGLILANKELKGLAHEIYYGENRFEIGWD
jgi:hypothetical protein